MANPKKFLLEFKEFAVKGNVIDLAVAVVIGGAFGKIVSSLVADIIMPPIGLLLGGINFSDLKILLKKAALAPDGSVLNPATSINIGLFFQNIFDFLIVAVSIFFFIKLVGRLKRQLKNIVPNSDAPDPIPMPATKEQELLTEIRDLLKNQEKYHQ